MTDQRSIARHERLISECRPSSDIGAILLHRYVSAIDLGGLFGHAYGWELAMLRAVCTIVEDTPFSTLSIAALDAAAKAPQQSPARQIRRSAAAGRLRRLLQATGELPSTAELAAERRIDRIIASAPPSGRRTLMRWDERRRRRLCAYERSHELRHLARLEQVIVDKGMADDVVLIHRWLLRTVRRIVACSCPPVTRATNSDSCTSCGATIASHGSRQSPSPAKQARLVRAAERYLAFRRLPTPTMEMT